MFQPMQTLRWATFLLVCLDPILRTIHKSNLPHQLDEIQKMESFSTWQFRILCLCLISSATIQSFCSYTPISMQAIIVKSSWLWIIWVLMESLWIRYPLLIFMKMLLLIWYATTYFWVLMESNSVPIIVEDTIDIYNFGSISLNNNTFKNITKFGQSIITVVGWLNVNIKGLTINS